uniref:Putative alpha-L-fucosidase n=1 Tax=Ixodes ricinus TaxID=34613 RepID=V5HEY6_IXORI
MRPSCIVLFLVAGGVLADAGRYSPDWTSLDTRPLPTWYDDAKVGIFLHWGVFSVPSFGSEWFWWHWQHDMNVAYLKFMLENYKPGFTYAEFAPQFTAQFFDPDRWADLFYKSGARYVVLTSKHHEGYTLWPSKVSWNWNAGDVGPKRDLVGDLAAAIRKKGEKLRFGLYHSLYEWYNPLYLADKAAKWTTNDFVKGKTMPELREVVERYKPDVIWSDGDWEASDTYWNSTEFLAWLYNDSPVSSSVMVNDRWGIGIPCKHGDFYNCKDHYNPGVLQKHKWENAMTIDKESWGYRRNAKLSDYHTIEELLEELARTISCNGNILINVGPTKDGIIEPVFEERLLQLGRWLSVNGEAVYGSQPWKYQNDTLTQGIWYTANKDMDAVYMFVLKWPKANKLTLETLELSPGAKITMLGFKGAQFEWHYNKRGKSATTSRKLTIELPSLTPDLLPTPWAWVLKIQGAL